MRSALTLLILSAGLTAAAAQGTWSYPHPLDTTKITLPYVMQKLNAEGRLTLYGIYFTSRLSIDPRSYPVLDVVASYLRQHPDVSLYVAGHTADTGSFEVNMRESDLRSLMIVKRLSQDLPPGKRIEGTRFMYHGIGPMSPLIPSPSPNAIAANTRFELIRRQRR
jgi:outer membrane protein OmpA-like peptidoglycan-associated protein